MSPESLFAAALATLTVLMALYSVGTRSHFPAVIGFVVYGVLLGLAWMALNCPDIALTEMAIGSGVTGSLLLLACARIEKRGAQGDCVAVGGASTAAGLIVSAGLAGVLGAVVWLLPEPAPSLAPNVTEHLSSTGLGNPVTAVLMSFRSLDTLLEKVVLFLAVVGMWSLAQDRAWGSRPGLPAGQERDALLRLFAKLLVPTGIVLGVYLLWVGADEPGGAFQGGAVLAGSGILAAFARMATAPHLQDFRLRVALVLGIAVFLLAGVAGMALSSSFLGFPPDIAKPIILVIEFAMLASIAASLWLLVAGPPSPQ